MAYDLHEEAIVAYGRWSMNYDLHEEAIVSAIADSHNGSFEVALLKLDDLFLHGRCHPVQDCDLLNMCIDMRIDVWIDMCVDVRIELCVDKRRHVYKHVHRHLCRHVYRHLCRILCTGMRLIIWSHPGGTEIRRAMAYGP